MQLRAITSNVEVDASHGNEKREQLVSSCLRRYNHPVSTDVTGEKETTYSVETLRKVFVSVNLKRSWIGTVDGQKMEDRIFWKMKGK